MSRIWYEVEESEELVDEGLEGKVTKEWAK